MSPLPRVALVALAFIASLLISTLLFALVFGSLIPALYAVFSIALPFFPMLLLALFWVYHLPERTPFIPPSHYRAIITFSIITALSMLPYFAAHLWIRAGRILPAILALTAYAGLILWAALIFSRSQALAFLTPDLYAGGTALASRDAARRKRRLYLSYLVLFSTWGALYFLFRSNELVGGILLAASMIPTVLLWRDIIASARDKP